MSNSVCPVSGETSSEEALNHITHLLGCVLSIAGAACLIVFSSLYGNVWTIVSSSIFSFTLVLLYAASTIYHGSKNLRLKRFFKVIDHSCIYLLIAGTYTPITLGILRGFEGWTLFGIEWGIAILGISWKIYNVNGSELFSTIAYLIMGWLIIFSWPAVVAVVPYSAIVLIVAGGLSYSFGTIFFMWGSLPYNHGIWHFFVLGGSACHYFAILNTVIT